MAYELLAKALKGPLMPAQQQQVMSALEADPRLIQRAGIGPKQLLDLVENTPTIAYEVLVKLSQTQRMDDYFAALAQMELSLHSMEVVKSLAMAVNLPPDFVHTYVVNCINTCEGTADKYMQNRVVRLVCVFLQSLIRQKVVNLSDLLHEIQAFAINYCRIREAAGLFRLLKQMESGGGKGGEGASAGEGSSSRTSMEGPGVSAVDGYES